MGKHTIGELHQMQSLPLSAKIKMTERRVREWVEYYGTDGVALAFSGGKDNGNKNKMESTLKKPTNAKEKNPNLRPGSFHNILQISLCRTDWSALPSGFCPCSSLEGQYQWILWILRVLRGVFLYRFLRRFQSCQHAHVQESPGCP